MFLFKYLTFLYKASKSKTSIIIPKITKSIIPDEPTAIADGLRSDVLKSDASSSALKSVPSKDKPSSTTLRAYVDWVAVVFTVVAVVVMFVELDLASGLSAVVVMSVDVFSSVSGESAARWWTPLIHGMVDGRVVLVTSSTETMRLV